VVHDCERGVAAFNVPGLSLLRRFFLPYEQQIFFYLETGIQRNIGFLHWIIQDICLGLQSRPLHSFVDRRINWASIEEATATSHTETDSFVQPI
jgi:hypothetical protein